MIARLIAFGRAEQAAETARIADRVAYMRARPRVAPAQWVNPLCAAVEGSLLLFATFKRALTT